MTKKNLISLNYTLNRLVLKKGKLSKISSSMNKVYLSLAKSGNRNPLEIINKAINNVMPTFLLSNKKMGKRVVIIPSFIMSNHIRRSLGFKWIIEASLKRKGSFVDNLVLEILEAYENKGGAKKRQRDINLEVLNNKSNLRYRW